MNPKTLKKNENAITRRLKKLQLLWDDFVKSSSAGIFCWQVRQDELTMIDAFYQVNADESSDTPDLFLRLESNFSNSNNYSNLLTAELFALVEAERDFLAEDDVYINWVPNYEAHPDNCAVLFLREFFRFAESLELDEGKIVVFLNPATIEDTAEWTKWWAAAASLKLPEQLVLMVCQTQGQEHLQDVANRFPDRIVVHRPEMDMDKAINELMQEFGDQEDDCTHFRKAFYALTQSVATGEPEAIKQSAQKALLLARKIDFPHLEIAVLCTAGNGFMLTWQNSIW